VRCGTLCQAGHQRPELRVDRIDRVAHPQAEIGRHLVVAAARGVQTLARLADTLGQAGLDVHVDVLEGGLEHETSGLDVGGDRLQPVADRRMVGSGQDAHRLQHVRMRQRTAYVLAPQRAVEADRDVDLLHDRRWTAGETTAPGGVGGVRRAGLCRRAILF
jgi:hypothetical protein